MLPIICKGRGLIPRVGMIAPVFTPFKVDFQTLTIIMKTPGCVLKPHFVDPDTSAQTLLTNTNWKGIYEKFQSGKGVPEVIVETKPDSTPKKEAVLPNTTTPVATIIPPATEVTTLATGTDKVNETQTLDVIPDGQETGEDKTSEDLTFTPITKLSDEDNETVNVEDTTKNSANPNGFNNYKNNKKNHR